MSRLQKILRSAFSPYKIIVLIFVTAFAVVDFASAKAWKVPANRPPAVPQTHMVTVTRTNTATNTPTPAFPICGPIQVLWDQTGNTGGGTASQDFEPAFDAYDATASDDFHVGSGSQWTIRKVVPIGTYFGGSGPADSFNVSLVGTLQGLGYSRRGNAFTIPLPSPIRSGMPSQLVVVLYARPHFRQDVWFRPLRAARSQSDVRHSLQ